MPCLFHPLEVRTAGSPYACVLVMLVDAISLAVGAWPRSSCPGDAQRTGCVLILQLELCFHPPPSAQEVYMNKELLQKLRGSSAAQGGAQQPAAAAAPAAPKAHHHFRLRPASEAPSQRHPGGSAAASGRPAAQVAPAAAAAPQAGMARGAAQPARPLNAGGLGSRGPGPASGAAPSATGRLRQTGGGADMDSMFLPRKPSLQRPAGLGVRLI